jgi:TonB-linked SusC/RagA family outer membrane protein
MDLKGKTVREVFQILEQKSNFRFFYNDEFNDIDQVVNLEIKNENVEQILQKIFESSDITYRVLDNNLIVLTLKSNLQQITIKGTVTDANTGDALPGVNVLVKGTTHGTTTDMDGKYSIEVGSGEIVIFSYVGYLNQEVVISNQASLDIKLTPDVQKIEEIVVIGYGVQKRAYVTGAMSNVSSKEINQLAVSNVQSALQGKAAGVSVTNNGGPGTDPIVRVRGVGSITYGADPLYVVDGVPATSLSSFDMRDIESLEVLKDASATAVYGSRAANGVILITTKKGKKDNKMHIAIDSYLGVQNIAKKLDLLNTTQYLQYATAYQTNAGKDLPTRLATGMDSPIYDGATQTYRQTNTDWQEELFQPGMINDNNISFSTGNERSIFYASAGYFKQEGIMVGTGYKRYSFRFNSEHEISKRIKIGQTLAVSYGGRDNQYEVQGRPNVMHMIRSVPYLPVTAPEGAIVDGGTKLSGGYRAAASGIDGNDAFNPLVVQKLFSSTSATTKVFGNIYLEVKIFDFLKFRTTMGLDYEDLLNSVHQPIYNDGGNSNTVAAVRRETFKNVTKMFSNQLTFEQKFGDHDLNIIAVQEQTPFKGSTMYTYGSLPTNAVAELTGAIINNANGSIYQNTLLSYLGRINYSFGGKYFLSASMRADGSSKFATGNKWGYFPAASVGWRISQENFMKSAKGISELKLRFGYGELGNNGGIGNYAWKAVINANTDYAFNNAVANGSYFNALDNPDLKWETSKMINIGLDLGLFENKISFTAEYFDKATDNLILNVPYAPSIGYQAAYPANIGKMNNHGFEFQIMGKIDAGILRSTLSANISIIRNKVEKLSTPSSTIDNGFNQDYGAYTVTRTVEGQPIQSFYGWVTDGIFQSYGEVQGAPTQVVTNTNGVFDPTKSTYAGDIKFKDLDGNGVIDANDRTFLGSYLPKFTYGLNYTGTIKNFDFVLNFQGVSGNKIYNGTKVLTQGMLRLFNAGTEVLNAWTSSNTNTDVPRAINGDPNQNARASDRFIEDGSYLRLKVLSIGYNLPPSLLTSLSKGTITGLRIYFTAQNLLTFTSYTGYDPEVGAYIPLSGNNTPVAPGGNPNVSGGGVSANNNGLLNNGVDFGAIPPARTFLFGIQLNF